MSKGKFDIYTVLDHLKEKRRYFSSEVDFQLALAMQIEREYGDNSVICEYVPEYESCIEIIDKVEIKSSRIHIDILYLNENIPIELKYRTKKADLEDIHYKIALSNQGAHDEGSYGFWRDVSRIGEYITKTDVPKGFAVFLTNDGWYKKPDYSNCKVDYEQFNLNETSLESRSGHVSNKNKELNNIPKTKTKTQWIDWDKEAGFICYIAEIDNKEFDDVR